MELKSVQVIIIIIIIIMIIIIITIIIIIIMITIIDGRVNLNIFKTNRRRAESFEVLCHGSFEKNERFLTFLASQKKKKKKKEKKIKVRWSIVPAPFLSEECRSASRLPVKMAGGVDG